MSLVLDLLTAKKHLATVHALEKKIMSTFIISLSFIGRLCYLKAWVFTGPHSVRLDMGLMLNFTGKDVVALPTVVCSGVPLQMKLAIMAPKGRL